MADLRDEFGNPIQLTDEHGNPVQLTDEYGNPVHITGVATSQPLTVGTTEVPATGLLASYEEEQPKSETVEHVGGEVDKPKKEEHQNMGSKEIEVSSNTSSSGSSEDDGHGGRRKKKGLKQKIKEKLIGGKHKQEHKEEHGRAVGVSTATTPGGKHHEHEKKSMMEKIKDILPGHHTH